MHGNNPFCLQYTNVNKWPQREIQGMIPSSHASPFADSPLGKNVSIPVK
jgi:hypothetical protein